MRQATLATAGFERYSKPTRRAAFLAEMECVTSWAELYARIEPVYPQLGKGPRPVGLERMLRIYLLQQWGNLSDPGVEGALYDSVTMRRFRGIDLGREPVPEDTTICKFRHLLEQYDLGRALFQAVHEGSGPAWVEAVDRHDRRRDHHPRAKLDQERGPGARSVDAPAQEGQPVAFWDEGACRGGQPARRDPRGGGDSGERGGRDDLA